MVTTCTAQELNRFASSVLAAIGMRADEARDMASIIVASDLAGHESHGMRRLSEYVERAQAGKVDPAGRPHVELDTGSLLRIDGGNAFGHTAFRFLTDLAIERARAHGICGIAMRRSSHAGRVADFCDQAADAGIAILFFLNVAGANQDVAPPGGDAPRIATNPIGAGIPRAGAPHLVLDMATSVVAMGRLAEHRDRGLPVPPEWVTPSGAIRPAGGVKGFGLALVAEALAGALSGAGTVTAAPEHDDQGVFVIAIDIERLRPLADFTAEVEQFLGYVRDVPLEPGAPPVRIPGESTATSADERRVAGVPVQEHTWRRLTALSAEFAIALPRTTDGAASG